MKEREKQFEIQLAIQNAGYNVVTCGECGEVFFHEAEEEWLECPHCGIDLPPCDCPDLYHEPLSENK